MGPLYQTLGRRYDHGLIACKFASKIKSKKSPKQLDYSSLLDKDIQARYEEAVESTLRSQSTDQSNISAAYANLCNAVKKAAHDILPCRKPVALRKRFVSTRTRELYAARQQNYHRLSVAERKTMNSAITRSCREDYREYIDSIIQDMEAAERVGNVREVTRLTKILTKGKPSNITPSKDLSGNTITSSEQLLASCNEFLAKKFAQPACDANRNREHIVSNDDSLSDEELDKALFAMKSGKASGWDEVPVELYKNRKAAREELYRIIRMIYDSAYEDCAS